MGILIQGGRVIDPAQNIDEIINVLIEDGKVAMLTHNAPPADRVIDATGKIVAPGFVDIHMHEDAPTADGSVIPQGDGAIARTMLRMGVTTAVGGNCGDNFMDPCAFLSALDEQHAPINMAMMVGHTYLRSLVGAKDKYAPATPSQRQEMAKLAEQALKQGCVGISYGIRYVPGITMEELLETSAPAKKYHRFVSAHLRSDAGEVFDSARELLDIGKALGVRIELSHIGSMAGFGQMKDFLALVDSYREAGLDVECDCYPYNAFSTTIGSTTYDPGWQNRYGCGFDVIELCQGEYKGVHCTEDIFNQVRTEHPDYHTICHVMKGDEVDLAFSHPHVMLGSDGILCNGDGHPRAAGAFPRFLARFVKTGLLDLSEGIRRMTVMPAMQAGLQGKGSLAPGYDGDVVIFDGETVADNATFQNNLLPPTGIEWVIVNGIVAAHQGEILCQNAGKPVRA